MVRQIRRGNCGMTSALVNTLRNSKDTAPLYGGPWPTVQVRYSPRERSQWQDYTAAIGTKWTDEDEALVDALVRPGHPSTPGYTDVRYPFFGRRLG